MFSKLVVQCCSQLYLLQRLYCLYKIPVCGFLFKQWFYQTILSWKCSNFYVQSSPWFTEQLSSVKIIYDHFFFSNTEITMLTIIKIHKYLYSRAMHCMHPHMVMTEKNEKRINGLQDWNYKTSMNWRRTH